MVEMDVFKDQNIENHSRTSWGTRIRKTIINLLKTTGPIWGSIGPVFSSEVPVLAVKAPTGALSSR